MHEVHGKMKTQMLRLLLCIILVVGLTTLVFATEPTGSNSIEQITSSQRTNFNDTAKTTIAQSGNLSQLEINITKQSNFWQGYYGNVSGTITLDDGNNLAMYSWGGVADVSGNIYATEAASVAWTSLLCANLNPTMQTFNCTGQNEDCLNLTDMYTKYGMNSTDKDGIDKTFTGLNNIKVDTLSLTSCPATNMYQNSSAQSTRWNETILTVNNTETLIYAAQTENNIYGFNNKTWDFQMLVGVNKAVGTTTYYFYVELY